MMILDTGLRLDWTLRLTFHCILGRKLRTFQSRAREDGMTIKEPRDGHTHTSCTRSPTMRRMPRLRWRSSSCDRHSAPRILQNSKLRAKAPE